MKLINEFMHQREILKQLRQACASGETSLVVEFERLLEFNIELARDLLYNPTETLGEANRELEQITKIPGMRLRVRGLDKALETGEIRAKDIGHFIEVGGSVTYVLKPKLVRIGNDDPPEFEDYQEIQLDDFLAVVLRRGLVGRVQPGDRVTLTGTLGAVQGKEFYDFILEANHLEVFNGHGPGRDAGGTSGRDLAEVPDVRPGPDEKREV